MRPDMRPDMRPNDDMDLDMDDDNENDEYYAYVVKEGESMQTIVDKTGVDACDIIKINQLKDILLKPGITIMLPVEK